MALALNLCPGSPSKRRLFWLAGGSPQIVHLPNELGHPRVVAQENVRTGNMEGGLKVKLAFHQLKPRVWNSLACENGEVGLLALAC